MSTTPTARYRLDALLHLLDRQIVGSDGTMAGKVDDLELTPPADDPAGAPRVTAIICGGHPLAARIGRRLGAWFRDESRIDFGVVKGIGSEVHMSLPAEDLPAGKVEREVWERLVIYFPGGRRHAGA